MIKKQIYLLLLLLSLPIAMMAECQDTVVTQTYQGVDSVEYQGTWYYETISFSTTDVTEEGCDSITIVTLIVNTPTPPEPEPDTISHHVLVNKFDWVLLVNRTILMGRYTTREPDEYRWYRNDQLLLGENKDHYSTNERLEGFYKLRIRVGERWLTDTVTIRPLEQTGQAEASVAPNPAVNGMPARVYYPGDFQYSILNQNGILVTNGAACNTATLPALPQGIYLVNVQSEATEVKPLKLVVQ